MRRIQTAREKVDIYFHNAKFDGEFIFYWLFENGYTWTDERKLNKKEFKTLISDKGIFYSIEIMFPKGKVRILNSLNILNSAVERIAKDWGLSISKLKIDYKEYRPIGHELTKDERDYIINDVKIVAQALRTIFNEGLTKMTAASDAMSDYIELMGGKENFRKRFPELLPPVDEFCRKSYRGGISYANTVFAGKTVGSGMVFDVNSLYPSRMYYCLLPFGEPLYYEGKYKEDKSYPLFIQRFECMFELKPNKMPTLQVKNTLRFCPTDFLESSDGVMVELTLTNVDLEMFFEHYNVYNVCWIDGYAFMASYGLFEDYINKWIQVKNTATITGNKSMRALAKLMMNSLYGKFGSSPKASQKIPVYMDGLVRYKIGKEETKETLYVPMASFITSYARQTLVSAIDACFDRFLYCDTDSIHILGLEQPPIEIDNVKLGAWKHEFTFSKAKYLHSKTYIEYGKDPIKNEDEYLKVTCCGMPSKCHRFVTFDNFEYGMIYGKYVDDNGNIINPEMEGAKLRPAHVKGGIVLEDTTFAIKEKIPTKIKSKKPKKDIAKAETMCYNKVQSPIW